MNTLYLQQLLLMSDIYDRHKPLTSIFSSESFEFFLNLLFLYVVIVELISCGIQPNESAILLFPLLYICGTSI